VLRPLCLRIAKQGFDDFFGGPPRKPETWMSAREFDIAASVQKVCEEIVRVNERICDLRPVPQTKDDQELAELKKKLQRQFAKKYRRK